MLGLAPTLYKTGPALQWEQLAGLGSVWINLWTGNGFDHFNNANLTAQDAAVANQATVGLVPGNGITQRAMAFGDGTNDAFEAGALTVAQPAAGRDRLWVLVFKPLVVGGPRDLFGWRDPALPFAGCDIQILAGLTWTGRYDWGAGDLPFTHPGVLTLGNWYVVALLDRQTSNDLIMGTTAAGGGAAILGATGGVAQSSTQPFALGEARTQVCGCQIAVGAFADVTGLGMGTAAVNTLLTSIRVGMIVP